MAMERAENLFYFNDGPACRQCGAGTMGLVRVEYAGSFSRRVFECQACRGTMILGRQSLNSHSADSERNPGDKNFSPNF